MNRHSVNAFTIMEATIAMLIAAIVIGMTYTIYNIVVRSYISYNKSHHELAVLIRLDELLKKDLDRSDVMLSNGNSLTFNTTQMQVNYNFAKGYITRTAGIADTFKVEVTEMQALFEGAVLDGTQNEGEGLDRIDELRFNIRIGERTIPYHYYKHYSSKSLLRKYQNAIN